MRITLDIPEEIFNRYDQYYKPYLATPKTCQHCGAELIEREPYCPNIACENLR